MNPTTQAIEVYPAATLAARNLTHTGYKDAAWRFCARASCQVWATLSASVTDGVAHLEDNQIAGGAGHSFITTKAANSPSIGPLIDGPAALPVSRGCPKKSRGFTGTCRPV